jgi:hypothetical protein
MRRTLPSNVPFTAATPTFIVRLELVLSDRFELLAAGIDFFSCSGSRKPPTRAGAGRISCAPFDLHRSSSIVAA